MKKKALYVPYAFWSDHADRLPDECALEVRVAANRVFILATDEQLLSLRRDAEFYAGRDRPDETPRNIIKSAAATLAAIEKFDAQQNG